MKVICDNCRAVYKIPDEKLAKPVNKATCRKCGHRMLIPRPRQGANPDEKTLVTAVPPTPPPAPSREYVNERPTSPFQEDEPDSTMPGLQPSAVSTRRPNVADDVQLNAPTPAPYEREARPAGRAPPPPPPAPDMSYAPGAASASAPIRRAITPPPPGPRSGAPTARSPAPRGNGAATPNTLGTNGDWKPSDAILSSISPQAYVEPPPRHEPAGRAMPASLTPAPRQRAAAPSAPAPAPLPAPAPAPAPYNTPSAVRNAVTSPSIIAPYDPANDLVLAMFGAGGGMVGTFILVLAFLTIPSLPPLTLVLIGIGMLLAFIGGMATLLVIITGRRGRAPARPLVSVALAMVVGSIVTTAFIATLIARAAFVVVGGGPVACAPRDDGSVVAASAPPVPPPIAAVAEVEEEPAPPAATPKPASSTPRTPKSSSSGGPSGPVAETFAPRTVTPRTTTSRVFEEEPIADAPPQTDDEPSFIDDEPPPPATPKSTVPDSVSDTVIDTILRNSIDVKKCFFSWQKQAGELPARVTVSFKITPAGAITAPVVTDADLKGTSLDTCLQRALTGIAMPPSTSGRTVKYPFILQ